MAIAVALVGDLDSAQEGGKPLVSIMAGTRPAAANLDITSETVEMLHNDVAAFDQWMQWAKIGRELLASLIGFNEVCVRYSHNRYTVRRTPGAEASRENLHHALEAINCSEKMKFCVRCQTPKIMEAFYPSAYSPDGKFRYCIDCERKRSRKNSKKAKA